MPYFFRCYNEETSIYAQAETEEKNQHHAMLYVSEKKNDIHHDKDKTPWPSEPRAWKAPVERSSPPYGQPGQRLDSKCHCQYERHHPEFGEDGLLGNTSSDGSATSADAD